MLTTSDNGISGTWSPASVDNQNSATYTFTPTAGLCATAATFTVTVNLNIIPTFGFGTALIICAGAPVPPSYLTHLLMASPEHGILQQLISQNSATYTFTPTAGLCATTATFTVTVNPILTTTFSIGTDLTICSGNTVPTLLSVSDNGMGTWNPATIDNQNSGVYTFTPATRECGTTAVFTVTVTPSIVPTFNFGSTLTICRGNSLQYCHLLQSMATTVSRNPAVVSNQDTGVYTFTPVTPLAQCITPITFKVNVNPILTPLFSWYFPGYLRRQHRSFLAHFIYQ